MHLFREERILESYGFKATFPIETDILPNLVLLNRLEEIIEKYKF